MSKITLNGFALLLLLFLGNSTGNYAAQPKQKNSDPPTGTFQRMIAENGSVTMDLDLNRLNGINSVGEDPPHCISLQLPIPFSLFWFLTISCAAPSRAQWHSSPKPNRFHSFPLRSPHLSNSSSSKNFRQTRRSIWLCATPRLDSRFLRSKDTSMIINPKRGRSASPAAAS